jgi:tetratricopeptide (TPR) repeat protein
MKKILVFLAVALMTATAAFAQSGTEDYDKQIAEYTQAISLNPDDAEAYNNRGKAYEKKEDYDRAIADYNKASKLDPHGAQGSQTNYNLMQLAMRGIQEKGSKTTITIERRSGNSF